ncbi:SDR family NAD(P)-dependent oxidoreductase [Angustibacter peucedani]
MPGPLLPEELDLSGRVAVVTGSGSASGIGFACARLLARCGAHVLVAATSDRVRDRAAELAQAGAQAGAFVGDLTDPDVADDLVRTAVARWGRVDVLINNAGMTSVSDPDERSGSITTTSPADWTSSLRRNLDTAFLVTRAAVPGMVAARWGRVVTVASLTGPVMATPGDVAYATAKAALVGMTRAAALDVASAGVTVNAVAPGWVATGSQAPHEAQHALAVPLGRSASPEEVASAVVWLASPGASYVTGQCVVVDGGNSVQET